MYATTLWSYDQEQVLDDAAAVKRRHVRPDGTAALHGTWTRLKYFRIRTEPDKLLIFDDAGRLARFHSCGTKDGQAHYVASGDAITFIFTKPAPLIELPGSAEVTNPTPPQTPPAHSGEGASAGTYALGGGSGSMSADSEIRGGGAAAGLSISPSLALAAYRADQSMPSGCHTGQTYIESTTNMDRVVAQRLVFSKDGKRLKWYDEASQLSLTLRPAPSQTGPLDGLDASATDTPTFSDTFAGTSALAQTAYPFYGFNPCRMRIYSEGGDFLTPGTPAQGGVYPDNPGQTFVAPLLFRFPAGYSNDYVRAMDVVHQPNLPIGRRWLPVQTSSEYTHSEVISSVKDRVDSWSRTFGMNAGVEKVFSVGGKLSIGGTVEAQRENAVRYVVARAVSTDVISILHFPSVSLHQDFMEELVECADSVVFNQGVPAWDALVNHFGTHYLHALTLGSVRHSETRLSMEAEKNALKSETSLEVKGEATMRSATTGGTFGYTEAWTSQLGTKVETEDVTSFSLGGTGAEAVGVLFDLRPISELLSPVLIPYSPVDPIACYAPWIWTRVRSSLEDYLKSIGMWEPQVDDPLSSYRPRMIKVSVGAPWMAGTETDDANGVALFGHLEFELPDEEKPDRGSGGDTQRTLLLPDMKPQLLPLDLNEQSAFRQANYCEVLARPHAPIRVKMKPSLGFFPPDQVGTDLAPALWRWDQAVTAALDMPSGNAPTRQLVTLPGIKRDKSVGGRLNVWIQASLMPTS